MPDQSAPRTVDEEWERLRQLLDLAPNRFWLVLAYAREEALARTVVERTELHERARARQASDLAAATPDALSEAFDEILERSPRAVLAVWAPGAFRGEAAWRDAWAALVQRCNAQRDHLRRTSGGLLLVLPAELEAMVARVASDLWSVRDLVLYLDTASRAPVAGSIVTAFEPAEVPVTRDRHATDAVSPGQLRIAPSAAVAAPDRSAISALFATTMEALASTDARNEIHRLLSEYGAKDAAVARLSSLAAAAALQDENLAVAAELANEVIREDVGDTEALARAIDVLANVAFVDRVAAPSTPAAANARRGLRLVRRLADAQPTAEAQRALATSLDIVGRLEETVGDFEAARENFSESVELRRGLKDDGPLSFLTRQLTFARRREDANEPGRWMADLASSLSHLARIEQATGDLDAASAHFADALTIRKRLADQLQTAQAERDLSTSLLAIGATENEAGDLDAARSHLTESLAIRERLARRLQTTQAQRDLGAALHALGRTELEAGNIDAASARLAEGLVVRRTLAAQLQTPSAQRDLCATLHEIGRTEIAAGNLDAANVQFAEGLAIARQLAHQLQTPQAQRDLCATLHNIGRAERAAGNVDAALAHFTESLGIARRLADQVQTPEARRDVSMVVLELGRTERAADDVDAALTHLAEGLAIARDLAHQLRTPRAQRDLSLALGELGRTEQASGNLDAARGHYDASLMIARHLANEFHSPQAQRDLAYAEAQLGHLERLRQIDRPDAAP